MHAQAVIAKILTAGLLVLAVFSVSSDAQTATPDGELRSASHGRTVRIRALAGGRVTTIPLEIYVARVLAAEGEPRAADAAQQALAVVSRTYALANKFIKTHIDGLPCHRINLHL